MVSVGEEREANAVVKEETGNDVIPEISFEDLLLLSEFKRWRNCVENVMRRLPRYVQGYLPYEKMTFEMNVSEEGYTMTVRIHLPEKFKRLFEKGEILERAPNFGGRPKKLG